MTISLLLRVLYSILSLVVNILFTSPSTFFIVFDNVHINVSKFILLGLNNYILSTNSSCGNSLSSSVTVISLFAGPLIHLPSISNLDA